MAVVPTGSFCRTSSSFRDLPSAERQARAQGLPGPSPTATGVPRGGGADGCTHWGPGGGTGGWGTTADLWGERNVTAHRLAGPSHPTAPRLRQGLCGPCGFRTGQERVQAQVGCPEISAKVFLLIATRGRRHKQAQRGLGHRGISAGPVVREAHGRGPTRRPLTRGATGGAMAGPWTYGS